MPTMNANLKCTTVPVVPVPIMARSAQGTSSGLRTLEQSTKKGEPKFF